MRITLGRSYKNGFDFWVSYGKNKCVINAGRDENGKIFVDCKDKPRNVAKSPSFKRKFLLMLFAIAMSLLHNYAKQFLSGDVMMVVFTIALWIFGYFGVYLYSCDKKNEQLLRYHAVEHMILNSYEKSRSVPKSIKEFSKEEKLYFTCGASLTVWILFIISAMFMVIPFLPDNIFFKIIIVLAAFVIPTALWIFGKLDFIQKLLIKTPTEKELEVGFEVMQKIYQLDKEYKKQEGYYYGSYDC